MCTFHSLFTPCSGDRRKAAFQAQGAPHRVHCPLCSPCLGVALYLLMDIVNQGFFKSVPGQQHYSSLSGLDARPDVACSSLLCREQWACEPSSFWLHTFHKPSTVLRKQPCGLRQSEPQERNVTENNCRRENRTAQG